LRTTCEASRAAGEFFIFFGRNHLKRLDSEKLMKINENKRKPFCFPLFSFACRELALWLYFHDPASRSTVAGGLMAASEAACLGRPDTPQSIEMGKTKGPYGKPGRME
jgi:hypothetical protein